MPIEQIYWFKEVGIDRIAWLANSPDNNHMEDAWYALERRNGS